VTGATGPGGKEGPKGATGAEGKEGAKGATGAAGATGATGATGPTGPAGATGAEGKEGPKGAAGAEGKEGKEGNQGPEGKEGKGLSVGKWETGKTAASGAEIEVSKTEPEQVVLTVAGEKEKQGKSKVEVEGKVIAETDAGGVGEFSDGDTKAVTFIVPGGAKFKVTLTAATAKYSTLSL
jgi:hypothetical protein